MLISRNVAEELERRQEIEQESLRIYEQSMAAQLDVARSSLRQREAQYVLAARDLSDLDVIAGIASKAIAMGRFEEAERMLLPHLDTLLERALAQFMAQHVQPGAGIDARAINDLAAVSDSPEAHALLRQFREVQGRYRT